MQEGGLDLLDQSGIVDVIEGTLMHMGFVPATQGSNTDKTSYDITFKRGLDEVCLQLPSSKGPELFNLIGNVPLRGRGTQSPDGRGWVYSQADIVYLLQEPFPDSGFFERFAGMPGDRSPHPLYETHSRRAEAVVETFRTKQPGSLGVPNSNGREFIYIDGRVEEEDLSEFLPIINRRTARRQDGIASLAGQKRLLPPPYGWFSRFSHEVTTFHVMRTYCDKFKIEGSRRKKLLAFALSHDDGHTFFGHPGEDYFKYRHRQGVSKFNHERSSTWHILDERANFDQVESGLADRVVACFNGTDPDHELVTADLGGVDRMQFLMRDPWEVGYRPTDSPSRLIPHLHFDRDAPPGERLWCDSADEAFRFVFGHGKSYETNYYGPPKQTDDALVKKLLWLADFGDINDSIPVDYNDVVQLKPLWQLNDDEVTFYLCNRHPDPQVNELARYWLLGGLGSAPSTVAILKRPGYEKCEGKIEVPRFDGLTFSEEWPHAQGVNPDQLNEYYQFWRDPKNQFILEHHAAQRLDLPPGLVVIGASPYVEKFITQKVPIRENGRGPIRQLREISPRYREPMQEISYRLQGLRLAVHPQVHDLAKHRLEKLPFAEIVKEAYEISKAWSSFPSGYVTHNTR